MRRLNCLDQPPLVPAFQWGAAATAAAVVKSGLNELNGIQLVTAGVLPLFIGNEWVTPTITNVLVRVKMKKKGRKKTRTITHKNSRVTNTHRQTDTHRNKHTCRRCEGERSHAEKFARAKCGLGSFGLNEGPCGGK